MVGLTARSSCCCLLPHACSVACAHLYMTVVCVPLPRMPSLQTPSLVHLVKTLVALVALGRLALVAEVLSRLPLFPEAALALHCPTVLVEL